MPDLRFVHIPTMTPSRFIHSNTFYRLLRSRLVVLLLLAAQLGSLLIVPLHAVAHNKSTHSTEAAATAPTAAKPGNLFSSLFGHELGLGCDDWSAAFSLDSHPGQVPIAFVTCLPAATKVSGVLPFASLPNPSSPFLARAPPRI